MAARSATGGAGRVIAGEARGRALVAPGPGTRPLSDRAKQAIFAILEPDLPGARVLDLFAGSGAGAIEALSRGADRAVLVEAGGDAIRAIRTNLERTGLADRAAVVRADLPGWLARPDAVAAGPFDLVLVDAPFPRPDLLDATLAALGAPGAALAPGARVVARAFWRTPPPGRIGLLASDRERRIGEAVATFYRRTGSPDPPSGPEEGAQA